jgi:exosortase J
MVALACLAAAAGLFTVHGVVGSLLLMWRVDDLKSMGLVVPFVAAALILRAWRGLGWRFGGSWWGFALLAFTAGLMFWREQTLFVVTVHPNFLFHRTWLLQLPPLPVVAVLYAASLVLLFGGRPLLRAAWFPVLLMFLVIPVPQMFSTAVDLPLQHASATVARAWAHALGEQLTPDKLRLMFTPDFGMFIAPGCNGIRGAVTLGLAALIVGYLYRFRWFVYAPIVAGAVLLGYLFNFLRLCLLVVYYKLALPHPWMRDHAKNADYVIGGSLFVLALAIFFTVANRLRNDPADVAPEPVPEPVAAAIPAVPVWARTVAVLALAAVFAVDMRHTARMEAQSVAKHPAMVPFPARLGDWVQTRAWTETMLEGTVIFTWAEYAEEGGEHGNSGARVAVGISPVLGLHDTAVCHMARGEEPLLVRGFTATGARGGDVALIASLYNDGFSQRMEASSVCDHGRCRQYTQSAGQVTLRYNQPRRLTPVGGDESRPVPVLLKAEVTDMSLAPEAALSVMEQQMQRFLAVADLPALTAPYGVQ